MRTFIILSFIFLQACSTKNIKITEQCYLQTNENFKLSKISDFHATIVEYKNKNDEYIFITTNTKSLYEPVLWYNDFDVIDSIYIEIQFNNTSFFEGSYGHKHWKQLFFPEKKYFPSIGYDQVLLENKPTFDKYLESLKCY